MDLNLVGATKNDNVLYDKLELFFQELYIAFKLSENDTFGRIDSLNLSRFVLSRYTPNYIIEKEITEFISKNCMSAGLLDNWSVDVNIIESVNNKDILYIVVKVIDSGKNGLPETFTEKFMLGL